MDDPETRRLRLCEHRFVSARLRQSWWNDPYSTSIRNNGTTPLNGTQIRLTVPFGVTSAAPATDPVTVQGSDIVYTIGRLAPGSEQTVQINVQITDDDKHVDMIRTQVSVTSGTAEPVAGNSVTTKVKQGGGKDN